MDDFEAAVETGTLPEFLKQDVDLSATGGNLQQSELESMMREMTDADLDKLASELGAGPVGKVGLMVPAGAEPIPPTDIEDVPTTKEALPEMVSAAVEAPISAPVTSIMADTQAAAAVSPEEHLGSSLAGEDVAKTGSDVVLPSTTEGKEKVD
jgi:hypothetical protein